MLIARALSGDPSVDSASTAPTGKAFIFVVPADAPFPDYESLCRFPGNKSLMLPEASECDNHYDLFPSAKFRPSVVQRAGPASSRARCRWVGTGVP